MKKASPKVSPTTLCARARIDGWAVLGSNLQPSFQDDRDVREWFKHAAYRLARGGGSTFQ